MKEKGKKKKEQLSMSNEQLTMRAGAYANRPCLTDGTE
jgi:hypothetical protein